MSNWREAELDLRALAEALEREAAFLAPVGGLRELGFGFYSRVLETGSGWIVRVARTAEAADRHAYECRLLPLLAPQLEVAIPEPAVALGAGEAAPYGAIAYRSLPGRVMLLEDTVDGDWRTLARGLALEVARLHDARLPEALALRRFDPDDFADLHAQVLPPLRERLTPAERATVDRWWEGFLGDESLRQWETVVTHGDIWWGNLLVDDGRLSGIVDWEFLSLGDAAWDLGTIRQFGAPFYEEMVREYLRHRALDRGWRHRADQWSALRVFFGVQFAIEREDEEEWVDALRKLRAGPILA